MGFLLCVWKLHNIVHKEGAGQLCVWPDCNSMLGQVHHSDRGIASLYISKHFGDHTVLGGAAGRGDLQSGLCKVFLCGPALILHIKSISFPPGMQLLRLVYTTGPAMSSVSLCLVSPTSTGRDVYHSGWLSLTWWRNCWPWVARRWV